MVTRAKAPSPAKWERVGVRVAALLLLSACELAPLDVTGLQCTDVRVCGDGFVCHRSRCVAMEDVTEEDAGVPDAGTKDAGVPDAGVPDAGEEDAGVDAGTEDAGFDAGVPYDVNLLRNWGFEALTSDGGVSSWRASTGRLAPSPDQRSGTRAARLYSSGMHQQMLLLPTVDQPGTEQGMLFCASMWIRAESDAGVDVTLTLRDRYPDGGYDSTAGVRFTARDGWRQVKEQHLSFGNSTLQLRLFSQTRFDAGLGFLVDDAVLMRPSGSTCP